MVQGLAIILSRGLSVGSWYTSPPGLDDLGNTGPRASLGGIHVLTTTLLAACCACLLQVTTTGWHRMTLHYTVHTSGPNGLRNLSRTTAWAYKRCVLPRTDRTSSLTAMQLTNTGIHINADTIIYVITTDTSQTVAVESRLEH